MSSRALGVGHPSEIPIPKLDHKTFTLPKWNDSLGARDEWCRKAIHGLEVLGGTDILRVGYVPVNSDSELESPLPPPMLPMAMTKDSTDLTLDMQGDDGSVMSLSKVLIKREPQATATGTPRAYSNLW